MPRPELQRQVSYKTTVQLPIGTFDAAAKIGGAAIACYTTAMLISIGSDGHPMTKNWPLIYQEFLSIILVLLYVMYSVWLGPLLMASRKSFSLKRITRMYNLFQVLICSWVCYEIAADGFFSEYGFSCEKLTYSNGRNSYRLIRAIYVYCLCKFLDLTDTIFMVLSKKTENITLLHMIHHSNMPILCVMGFKHAPDESCATVTAMINSAIHVALYTYYFLSSFPQLKNYLWWKKYLTRMQLIQFVMIFVHSLLVLVMQCPKMTRASYLTITYSVVFFWLFADFYYNVYVKAKREAAKQKK